MRGVPGHSYRCGTEDLIKELDIKNMEGCNKAKEFKPADNTNMTNPEACFCDKDLCNAANGDKIADECSGAKALNDLGITEWVWACILFLAFSKNIFGF